MWKIIAKILARPAVTAWLINRSFETPYMHLPSNEDPSYMGRFWLFNPYDRATNKPQWRWCPWSIRIHHIKRADAERDMHDHPWNARTIILQGGYVEERLNPEFESMLPNFAKNRPTLTFSRSAGDTAKLGFEQYHRITHVTPGGAWTLFISGPWRGVWGFLVDGVKVKWREYLGLDQ